MQWRVLQLADSAFPAGGFAHSGGLEAATWLGEVRDEADVARFAASALAHAARFALPFVHAAHGGGAVAALDARCEASIGSHVARRASRVQGRGWLRACRDIHGIDVVMPHGHLPIAFGATTARLDVPLRDAGLVYLQLAVRGPLGAAVRLGRIGPSASGRLLDQLGEAAERELARVRSVEDAASPAPLEELFGMMHDALPARLFQS